MKNIKSKEPVKLRFKKIANGNTSIYLDIYTNGQRQYDFLKLYLIPEKTPSDKSANEQTLSLANAVKAKRIVDIQNSAHGFITKGKFSKVNVIEYIQGIADKRNNKGTGRKYEILLAHLKRYGSDTLTFGQIDKGFCLGFIDYLKKVTVSKGERTLHNNTQSAYLQLFNTVIIKAISDGIMEINPLGKIRREDKPKMRKTDICYLTVDEIKAMENTPCVNDTVKRAFLFACYTGLRYSDVVALTWGNLHKDETGKTYIDYTQKKTKKSEHLPISDIALKYLPVRGDATDTDIVYCNMVGNGYFNMFLGAWAMQAGISKRVTFHVSRHTHATLLLSLGVSIETVSSVLGHSDIKTTQIYAKVLDESKRKAADKLDNFFI